MEKTKKKLFHKSLLRKSLAMVLAVAMTVTTLAVDGLAVAADAASVSISTKAGYEEGAYLTWAPVEGADGYEVYVSKNQTEDSFVKVDDELIRSYPTEMRVDVLGLSAGTWYVKVVAGTYNSAKERMSVVAETISEVTVAAHDRAGFAWTDGTASGAYNEDGTLKSDAKVLYLTEANKDKITTTVTTADGTKEVTGIQNILLAYKPGVDSTPLDIRVIGTITDPAFLTSGDLAIENAKNGKGGITIEGVGEDAVIRGFGFALTDAANVEIRNLAFMLCDSGEGDNVSLVNGNNHVWVHHCDFFYGMPGTDSDQKKGDGMLDCKLSNYVTFSYNHFWDCGKSCLLGLEGENNGYYITYHHNWFDHSDSRHPRARFYNAHVYNNFYDGNSKYGIGAANGSNIFAEANYFRGGKYPMIISMQGSEAGGTLSGEAGGMIKAYGNFLENNKSFIRYDADKTGQNGPVETTGTGDGSDMTGDSVEFDAYVASTRDEKVPATVTAKKGGATYSNFDTAEGFYSYTAIPAKEVPEYVSANAGRLNGGDISYKFNNNVADSSSDIDETLKALLVNYTTKLVSVGGILGASEKSFVTVTFDTNNGGLDVMQPATVELNQPLNKPANPSNVPEGYVAFGYWMNGDKEWDFADAVTGEMTLTAKWFTQAEYDAAQRGGKPIGTDAVQFIIANQTVGFGNPYFEIVGNTKHEFGTSATYDRLEGESKSIRDRDRLILDNNAAIRFTTSTDTAMLALVLDSTQQSNSVLVDGVSVTATNGVVLADLAKGDHEITSKSANYAYAICVFPDEKVPVVDLGYEVNPNNMSLNVAEDIGTKTFSEAETVNGFTISASLVAENNNKSVDGNSYSARLKTGGAGSTAAKNVCFHAEENATLYLAAMSSSGSATRNVTVSKVVDGKETAVSTFTMDGSALHSQTVKLTGAGTYYIYADGGLNIYYISVTYPNLYTVSFDAQGGSAVQAMKVSGGSTIAKLPTSEKAGYTFLGWYTDAACTTPFTTDSVVNESMVLYADWANEHTVTFYDCFGNVQYQTVKHGECAEYFVLERAEFIFRSWNYRNGAEFTFDTPITEDLDIFATWMSMGLTVEFAYPNQYYSYTGQAIKPEVIVKNNGVVLTEGVDYTLKYGNNVNANVSSDYYVSSNSPKGRPYIDVIGKGNLTASTTVFFDIHKVNISYMGENIVTDNPAKAVPTLVYAGNVLKAGKDFVYQISEDKKYCFVQGKGNYDGANYLPIVVKTKAEQKKFTVELKENTVVFNDKYVVYPRYVVKDAQTKTELNWSDFTVYTGDCVNVGTVKMTFVGRGDYAGTVVYKTYKILPVAGNPIIDKSMFDNQEFIYNPSGVTFDNLIKITIGTEKLKQGVDYTVKYSNNKKVGTAKYTISFMGNYKKTAPITGTFKIIPASFLGLWFDERIDAKGIDMTYGKPGIYKGKVDVSVDYTMLKKSDYTIQYYLDDACTTEVSKSNSVALAEGETEKTVYVKLTGKGNYTDSIMTEFTVHKVDKAHDLSKAKITCYDEQGNKISKMEYTGLEVAPAKVVVTIGTTVVPEDAYEVYMLNNVNKGKATVYIYGVGGEYAGTKSANLTIVAKKLKK